MSPYDPGVPRLPTGATPSQAGRHARAGSLGLRRSRTTSLMAFVCMLALLLSTTTPAFATGGADPANVVVDVLVARPVSFIAMVGGATLFVISLPFAATSRSVRETTTTLVAAPAKDLFSRPMGDLDDWLSY
jgi:hypothetical protein